MREHGYERSMEIFSPEEMREVLKNPGYLPTHEEISYAFTGKSDTVDKMKIETERSSDHYHDDGNPWHEFLDEESSFYEFCYDEKNPTFEFLNEEYLNDLTNYLIQRIGDLNTSGEPVAILEIGAGNGRLTHFLKKKLESKIPGKFNIVASDSGHWELKTEFPVEKIEHKDALKKHKPSIAIFSWMPYRADYTPDFRATESIDEYILIGESDGGCCGNNDTTWDKYFEPDGTKPTLKNAAFIRYDLDDVSKNQLCRTDALGLFGGHSRTVSFRREKTAARQLSKKYSRRNQQPAIETAISP